LLIILLCALGLSVGIALASGGYYNWAGRFGGSSPDHSLDIIVDAAGNVYTTGYFSGTADFDPGPGTGNLTSAGGFDIFVSKLDSDGNYVWAKSIGGASTDIGYGIAVDGAGNVYTSGYFESTADFDPGPGTTDLTSAGGKDIFVSKLEGSGNYVWAKSMGGTSDDYGYGIAVDGAGNVYTTGHFYGTADFDPGPGTADLTSAGHYDIFVSKLEGSGNYVWAKSMGGSGPDYGYGIAVDGAGNVYPTGDFNYTVDFDPGPGTANLTSAGNSDIFVSRLGADVEMDVQGDGNSIPDGDTIPDTADLTDFGDVTVGDAQLHTFVIKNTGGEDIDLTDNPRITIAGTHAADFSLTTDATTPVAGNGQITYFQITFEPSATGTREATVSIANNDYDENPYNFSIQGNGIGAVSGSGTGLGQDGSPGFTIGSQGGVFTYGPVKVLFPQLHLSIIEVDAAFSGNNIRLGKDGRIFDIIVRDYTGAIVSDFDFPIGVCIKPTAAELRAVGGNRHLLNVFHKHGGSDWEVLTTFVDGEYVCAVVYKLSLFGLGIPTMPETGFVPGMIVSLPEQPTEKSYFDLDQQQSLGTIQCENACCLNQSPNLDPGNDLRLEIPTLGLKLPIVGVPLTADGWDVSWLVESAGWLQGTAFPTWPGNTAITAHVWDAQNQPGPFIDLHTLQHGDQIIIQAFGQKHVYEVREVIQVRADDLRALPHSEYDMLTLITCQGYDEASGEYDWRLAVRAVLINIK